MAVYYDICERGDLLLQFSDKELGALVRALLLYRGGSGSGPEALPRRVRAVFAVERMRIDRAEERRKQLGRVRREAARKKWEKQKDPNACNCMEMHANAEKRPPLSTPVADSPDISPFGENMHPRTGVEGGHRPKKQPRPRFEKPSAEAVREYCESRRNSVDAGEFCDFYDSRGWLIGKVPMRDWRAAVRTWERSGIRRERESFRSVERMPL